MSPRKIKPHKQASVCSRAKATHQLRSAAAAAPPISPFSLFLHSFYAISSPLNFRLLFLSLSFQSILLLEHSDYPFQDFFTFPHHSSLYFTFHLKGSVISLIVFSFFPFSFPLLFSWVSSYLSVPDYSTPPIFFFPQFTFIICFQQAQKRFLAQYIKVSNFLGMRKVSLKKFPLLL